MSAAGKLPFRAESCRLTPKQVRVAGLLAAGRSVKAAAAAAGAGERTVHTWLQRAEFRALVAAARDAALCEAVGKLSAAAGAAVSRLRALVDSADEATALRASVAVLDQLVRVREFAELGARMAELESRVATPDGGAPWG